MIVVTVYLASAVDDSRSKELARMVISNDGERSLENPNMGTYVGETYKGRDGAALDRGTVSKRAVVKNWPRTRFHVWNLVSKMLKDMGYTEGANR